MNKTPNIINQLKLLLAMEVVGSIIGIENSQAFGCIVGFGMFSIGNLIFLGISSILIIKAIKTQNKSLRVKLLIIETAIWVFKYFLYKGGYITGFGGTANPINVVYDFISIGFRFLIIKNLISQTRLKIIGALLISTLIVAIKINVFAFPLFLKIMWELEDKRTEEQRIQLLGNFSGTIRQLSTHQEKPIKLSIDSNLLSIGMEPPFNLKEKYNFNLNYFSYGEIGTKNGLEYEILIEKINDDSLVMKFTDFYKEKYKLRLKTER